MYVKIHELYVGETHHTVVMSSVIGGFYEIFVDCSLSRVIGRGGEATFKFRIFHRIIAVTQPFLDGLSKTKYLQILWDEF